MDDLDTYPRSGVWLERVRLSAELMVVVGGAVLAVVTAAEELREIRSIRGERALDEHVGCRRERDDGGR